MDEDFARELEKLDKQAKRVEAILQTLPVLPEQHKQISSLAIDIVTSARGEYRVSRGDNAAIRALHLLSEHLLRRSPVCAEE